MTFLKFKNEILKVYFKFESEYLKTNTKNLNTKLNNVYKKSKFYILFKR